MPKPLVLIIEDSAYLSESLKDLVKIAGFDVAVANTGREGILLAREKQPKLILLDIRLPDIDGYEVYHEIKNKPWGKNINVVVLTASESVETVAKNIDLPLDKVLFKPRCDVSYLIEKIKQEINPI